MMNSAVLREDPDYKPAQVLLKNILKVDRAKLAANELYVDDLLSVCCTYMPRLIDFSNDCRYKAGSYEEAKEGYTEAINIDKLNAAVTSKLYVFDLSALCIHAGD